MATAIEQIPLDSENKEEWQRVRASLPKCTVFGSEFPTFFGHGYDSLARTVDIRHGRREKKPHDMFLEQALQHGITYEKYALDWFLELLMGDVLLLDPVQRETRIVPFKASVSSRYQLNRDPACEMFLTPDATLFVRNPCTEHASTCIVEIKCPTRQQSKYESVEEWVDSFLKAHPYGYTKAFLQAALYASVDPNAEEIFVVHCFVHKATNMAKLVTFGFKMNRNIKEKKDQDGNVVVQKEKIKLHEWCLDHAQQFSRCLHDGEENLRVPSARKLDAEDKQRKCWYRTMISDSEFICYSSEKDSGVHPSDELDKQDGSDAGQ